MLPWILAHWEEYHTGILLYGNGWFGVMEANYALAVVHLLVYFFGVGMWTKTLNEILPLELPITVGECSRFTWMLTTVQILSET